MIRPLYSLDVRPAARPPLEQSAHPHDREKIVNAPAPAGIATLIATIPAANLAVTHFGAVPAGFGYAAPAGVYMVGLALVLRDLAREAVGRGAVLAAIAIGTVLSYLLADPSLATASAVAFAVAETMDFAVYEPLRQRGLLIAMLASNAVGLLADSLLFLKLAFNSFEYLWGQILGKTWMTFAAVAALTLIRRRKHAAACTEHLSYVEGEGRSGPRALPGVDRELPVHTGQQFQRLLCRWVATKAALPPWRRASARRHSGWSQEEPIVPTPQRPDRAAKPKATPTG
ncbi:VUT family protein [Streptomyces atratus]|uniref:VUT family protein n=1 Tax=Streptomyces atratus TaxID=1893 RepID=UPI003391DA8C